MIRIILNGCNGKMGNVISKIASKDSQIKIVCGFDLNTDGNFDYEIFDKPDKFAGEADVIIDFSHPQALDLLLSYAVKRNIPIVIATTGLSKEQVALIREASLKIPVFYTANMSLGVNLIIDLAKKAARLLEDKFDIEIVEKHHNQKIDAPSGTALAIADAINEELSQYHNYVYDRHSVRKKRDSNEIGIHAIRGGTIVGEHEIIFAGNDEIITISHTAMSKDIFAEGCIKAAKYLFNKSAGLYDMNSLIKET